MEVGGGAIHRFALSILLFCTFYQILGLVQDGRPPNPTFETPPPPTCVEGGRTRDTDCRGYGSSNSSALAGLLRL